MTLSPDRRRAEVESREVSDLVVDERHRHLLERSTDSYAIASKSLVWTRSTSLIEQDVTTGAPAGAGRRRQAARAEVTS